MSGPEKRESDLSEELRFEAGDRLRGEAVPGLEHPPIMLKQHDRGAASPAFESGAVSDRPDGTIRLESALMVETQRLLLRVPGLMDAAAIAELADNARIAHNLLGMPHPYRLEDARIWIEEPIAPGGQKYVICLKSPDAAPRLIGAITVDFRRGSSLPTLGAWIGEDHWGRDYATEAAHAVVDYAFLHQKHERLSFTCRVTNDAGRRVIEKCGFQLTAQELGHSRFHNAVVPVNRFTLERRIWESLRRWEPLRVMKGE